MSKTEWYIIGRGFAGWHATGHNVSSSGGDIVERQHYTGQRMAPYQEAAIDGALVYDASGLEGTDRESAFIRWVCLTPTFRADMAPDAIGGGYCGIKAFEDSLRQIGGVKFGTVRDGEIVWE